MLARASWEEDSVPYEDGPQNLEPLKRPSALWQFGFDSRNDPRILGNIRRSLGGLLQIDDVTMNNE
ncbi:hypothetical protein CXB51_007953 [Gossypium anomalum]|uniref:Uncharacterized protein n=1 Tax=Gossypium anomalum TaxID=47600 RepID=A0A8J5YUM4_9ROSI|nr:hypothetical protein CXB51_007953 [Gossypium anomalum]